MYSYDYDRIADYSDADDCADTQQQLLEYEMYIHEQHKKAHALLSLPAALDIARKVAEDLEALVKQHASADGDTTVAHMLRDSVGERVIEEALKGREHVLQWAVTRQGFIAIRKALDDACEGFEKLLSTARAY